MATANFHPREKKIPTFKFNTWKKTYFYMQTMGKKELNFEFVVVEQ